MLHVLTAAEWHASILPETRWHLGVNEITGFSISLYPQLMLKAQITYPQLISKLLTRALNKYFLTTKTRKFL